MLTSWRRFGGEAEGEGGEEGGGEEDVHRLVEMGFAAEGARAALRQSAGDRERAIELLLR